MAVIEYLSVILGLDHSKFDVQVQQAAASATSIKKAIAGAVAAGGAIKLGIDSVKLAAEAETAQVSFEVLTGSADKARQAIDDFRQIDRETPLSFIDIQRGAKTMLAFGVEADDLGKRLRQLAAVSMGNEERFQSLALAFGQTTAAGRLMGQETLQFVNAGFSPLQQVSKMTGIEMGELKKAMEDGAISVDIVKASFDAATEKGGLFYGMNEKIANTTSGQLAKLSGDFKMLGVEVGEALVPALKDVVELLRETAQLAKDSGVVGLTRSMADGARSFIAFGSDVVNSFPSDGKAKEKSEVMNLFRSWNDQDVAALQKMYTIQNRIKEEKKEEKKITHERIKQELEAKKNMAAFDKKRKEDEAREEKRKQEQEKMIEEQKRLREQNERDAFGIRSTNDPRLAVREDIKNAAGLMRGGFLSRNDFEKYAMNLARSFAESQVQMKQDTPFAAKGTVEAYKLLLKKDSDREEEKQLQRDANAFLADIKRELSNRPPIAVLKR